MKFDNCFGQKDKQLEYHPPEIPILSQLMAELCRPKFECLPPAQPFLPEIQIYHHNPFDKHTSEETLATGDVVRRCDDGRMVIEMTNGETLTVIGLSWNLKDKDGKVIVNPSKQEHILSNGASFGFIVPFSGPGWFYISYPNKDGVTIRYQNDSNLSVNIHRGGKSATIDGPPYQIRPF